MRKKKHTGEEKEASDNLKRVGWLIWLGMVSISLKEWNSDRDLAISTLVMLAGIALFVLIRKIIKNRKKARRR
ncbi:MAG: hypothetical protein KKG59_06625 [Nanoarchaeota archaeon]|nr:hypothetical protein [Nanoarchaeota archaeon]